MHFADPTLTLVAAVSFILSYLIGLKVGDKLGVKTLWPSVVVTLVAFFVRAESPPLSIASIAAISVVHFCVACLTVLILRNTAPRVKQS